VWGKLPCFIIAEVADIVLEIKKPQILHFVQDDNGKAFSR
jgi:hypothetical protein